MQFKQFMYRVWRISVYRIAFGQYVFMNHILSKILWYFFIKYFGSLYVYNAKAWKCQLYVLYRPDVTPLEHYAHEYGMSKSSVSDIIFNENKSYIFFSYHGIYTIQKIAAVLSSINSMRSKNLTIVLFRRTNDHVIESRWQEYCLSMDIYLKIVYRDGFEFLRTCRNECCNNGIVIVLPDYYFSCERRCIAENNMTRVVGLFLGLAKLTDSKVGIINTLRSSELYDSNTCLQWCEGTSYETISQYQENLKSHAKGWFFKLNYEE